MKWWKLSFLSALCHFKTRVEKSVRIRVEVRRRCNVCRADGDKKFNFSGKYSTREKLKKKNWLCLFGKCTQFTLNKINYHSMSAPSLTTTYYCWLSGLRDPEQSPEDSEERSCDQLTQSTICPRLGTLTPVQAVTLLQVTSTEHYRALQPCTTWGQCL